MRELTGRYADSAIGHLERHGAVIQGRVDVEQPLLLRISNRVVDDVVRSQAHGGPVGTHWREAGRDFDLNVEAGPFETRPRSTQRLIDELGDWSGTERVDLCRVCNSRI